MFCYAFFSNLFTSLKVISITLIRSGEGTSELVDFIDLNQYKSLKQSTTMLWLIE